jgi:ubiquitin-protein ligase
MVNPRDRRLQTDYLKVRRLAAGSGGTLTLVKLVGNPPTSYVIEYRCPSLVYDQAGSLVIRTSHRAEINLGLNYPLEKPNARMLTPVFNPHVFPYNNAICLGGVWSAAETLDTLVLRIGALLQLDPRVLDPKSPANGDANQWVQRNLSRIPLGTVSFKAGARSLERINWL